MFQTEPILYLQSLGNECFTFLMVLITTLGSPSFLVAVLVITTFGVDFKKGVLLFQLLMWTLMVIAVLKIIVAFPRPDFVDNRVVNLESGIENKSLFNGNGHNGFFALLDEQVLKAFRLQEEVTNSHFGFPSGHVALTAALWGGNAVIFGNRIIKKMTPLMIIIMAFSRMYLGRHFLGDVLGGAIVGLICLIVFMYLIKSSLKDDFFKKQSFEFIFRRQNLLFYSFMFILPILLTALSLISADIAGFFLGTNLAYVLIIQKGIPYDTGNATQRTSRVFIAFLLFGVSSILLNSMFETAGTINYFNFTYTEFLKTFIPSFTIWISVVICTKLGLYKRDKEIY